MNIQLAKRDLQLLSKERARLQQAGKPAWSRETWKILSDSSFDIFLFDFPLPANAHPRRVALKIEGRPNLYDPAEKGLLHFYRNVWVGQAIEVLIPGTRRYGPLPRVHAPSGRDGWRYFCIHPGRAQPEENILSFLRIIALFVKNADPRKW